VLRLLARHVVQHLLQVLRPRPQVLGELVALLLYAVQDVVLLENIVDRLRFIQDFLDVGRVYER